MVMGSPCTFQGTVLPEIISVQVAAPTAPVPAIAPAPPVPPIAVVPPVPTVSAAFVNGVIVVTANNIAANTAVQVVYDLTGEDVIALSNV